MLANLQTEQPNWQTERLDISNSLEIVTLMNHAEKMVPQAVEAVLPKVALAVDHIVDNVKRGGRLFYVGAGTSGRLGILDATECPPTFGTSPDLVQYVMAGGESAVFEAVEHAEDDDEAGAKELRTRRLSKNDSVIGLTASGRTPFVIGAIREATRSGALTVGVTCNLNSDLGKVSEISIDVDTGPEVLMGSTRLKAGTAQKMVLNMISTATMVRLGKVYKNLMVDLKVTNEKLLERAKRIVMVSADVDYQAAEAALEAADGHVKTAILMVKKGVDKTRADTLLAEANGFLRIALGEDI
ncbi:N-acetylmuramic acid 6-phosphate etherase [Alicyclobacillus curvatus]|nr:N-acetylmuramic acid 6-phosphate etherase [Alicyclobacillus curvatus]